MVPVNSRPLSVSSVSAPGTFTFRKDSAGLGVPRDFGELRSVSSDVAHHGQVNTEVERSVIGPSQSFAHRDANGIRNANSNAANGNRGLSDHHEYTPGSRSVGTFSRADMRANGGNGMEGWNGMNRANNGTNNGMNNGANQGGSSPASPRGTWQRPEGGGSAGAPMQRSTEASRTNATAPSSGGSSSSGGGSHK
jgi:hypothetical protein